MAYIIQSQPVINDAGELTISSMDGPTISMFAYQLLTSNTIVAGTTDRTSDATLYSRIGSSPGIEVARWHFMQRGIARFSFDLSTTNSSGPSFGTLARRRAGSNAVISTQTGTTARVTKTADLGVLPGDLWYLTLSGGAYTSGKSIIYTTGRMSNIKLQTSSDTYFIPTTYTVNGGRVLAIT